MLPAPGRELSLLHESIEELVRLPHPLHVCPDNAQLIGYDRQGRLRRDATVDKPVHQAIPFRQTFFFEPLQQTILNHHYVVATHRWAPVLSGAG